MDHIVNLPEHKARRLEEYINNKERCVAGAHAVLCHLEDKLTAAVQDVKEARKAWREAREVLTEQVKTLDRATVAGRRVLYGQPIDADIDMLLEDDATDDEDAYPLYDGPCLLVTLDTAKTKRLADLSSLVKRSHIAGQNLIVELKPGKMLRSASIKEIDPRNIVKVVRIGEPSKRAAVKMFTKPCELDDALERVKKAASDNEGKVLFSRELLLEMGVHSRGIRGTLQAIAQTVHGNMYEVNELLFLENKGEFVIANPIVHRSVGVYCALADPKEALDALWGLSTNLSNKTTDLLLFFYYTVWC